MASESLMDAESPAAGGNITRFPIERARAPALAPGILRTDRRAHYVERARGIMHGVRHKDTGILLTPEEQERFAGEFVGALEAALIEMERNR